MTHSELAAAHEAQDYALLWREAVPLAHYALRQMTQVGQLDRYYIREDLVQEAVATAGEAIRTWDPIEGAFSTWIVAAVRGAILQYIAREAGGIQAAHLYRSTSFSWDDELFESINESHLTYEHTPEGYADPSIEAEQLQQQDRVSGLLGQLRSPEDQDMLTRLYGLDCEAMTQSEYAFERGVSLSTVKKRLASTLEYLAHVGKKLLK